MLSDEGEEEYSACEGDLSDASDRIVGGGGGDDDVGVDYIEGDGGGDCARKRRIHTIKLEGPAGENFQHFKKLLSEALSKRSGDVYSDPANGAAVIPSAESTLRVHPFCRIWKKETVHSRDQPLYFLCLEYRFREASRSHHSGDTPRATSTSHRYRTYGSEY